MFEFVFVVIVTLLWTVALAAAFVWTTHRQNCIAADTALKALSERIQTLLSTDEANAPQLRAVLNDTGNRCANLILARRWKSVSWYEISKIPQMVENWMRLIDTSYPCSVEEYEEAIYQVDQELAETLSTAEKAFQQIDLDEAAQIRAVALTAELNRANNREFIIKAQQSAAKRIERLREAMSRAGEF